MIAIFISMFTLVLLLAYIHFDIKNEEMKSDAFKEFRRTVFDLIKNQSVEDLNDGED